MPFLNKLKSLIRSIAPKNLIGFYHFFMAFLGAVLYGFPSKKIKVIGVTGTKGKSTVVEMIAAVLKESGYNVALSSSIRFKINEKERKNDLRMTMPGRLALQKFLRESLNSGCEYVILEVSSEGLEQHRHRFIDFEAAVFTNLEAEHIESHGSFENYRKAKEKLFKAAKNVHVINLDDENAEHFLQYRAKKKYCYSMNPGLKNESEELKIIRAENVVTTAEGIRFFVNDTIITLSLLGKFNIYNALAAICVGLSQNVGLEVCKEALLKLKGIPGRMQVVISEPFKVIIDYAVTPKSLKKAYESIKEDFKPKRLICVLGACGGGRDKWKRKILGKIASSNCDIVILTNEDPYDENPIDIINQIAEGAGSKAKKILDRKEAIGQSLIHAKKGDIVVVTGKGSESSMCLANGVKIPWDDRETAIKEFEKLKS